MALSVSKRRIVSAVVEAIGGGAKGTFRAPTITADAIPSIRSANISRYQPLSVERETLRASLTGVPNIYPGVAIVDITFVAEVGGVPNNASGTATYASPVWTDLIRACGFEEISNQSTPATPTGAAVVNAPKIYSFANQTGGTGLALRHGETVAVTYATTGGPIAGTVIGDTFADDDLICIDEDSGTAGTGNITITGATSGRATSGATPVRDTSSIVALKLLSDVNRMETISMELYLDGKRMRLKGCMGNFDFRFVHGDVLHAEFTMTGIQEAYADVALPTNANESHYVPPTFLGKDLRIAKADASLRYGKDTGSALQVGALNQMNLRSGNTITMRENSFDASGVSFALVTSRQPEGSFNPDEVANTEFNFMSAFLNGEALRMKAFIGALSTGDGNSIDFIAPGLVFKGLADQSRDEVNVWDASFNLTGGDYDSSAVTEIFGNDNELTILYR